MVEENLDSNDPSVQVSKAQTLPAKLDKVAKPAELAKPPNDTLKVLRDRTDAERKLRISLQNSITDGTSTLQRVLGTLKKSRELLEKNTTLDKAKVETAIKAEDKAIEELKAKKCAADAEVAAKSKNDAEKGLAVTAAEGKAHEVLSTVAQQNNKLKRYEVRANEEHEELTAKVNDATAKQWDHEAHYKLVSAEMEMVSIVVPNPNDILKQLRDALIVLSKAQEDYEAATEELNKVKQAATQADTALNEATQKRVANVLAAMRQS